MPLMTGAASRRLLDERLGTRAMMWIMAIMLFLTVLAAALGLGTLSARHLLDRQLVGRLTVQIVAPVERDRIIQTALTMATIRATPGVKRAVEVDRAQLAALLRPWLGADGADPDLPVPAMIDVDLDPRRADTLGAVLTARVHAVAPSARVDRHESWMSPISAFMALVSGLAGGLVLLMATATTAVVILAARAGLEAHRDTIEVLHMLGSTDVQVARLFQRRIALDTLIGGVCGAILAIGIVVLIGWRLTALGSDLMSGLILDPEDWVLLALLPIAFALIATGAARVAVLASLRRRL